MFMQQFPYKSCQRETPIRKSVLMRQRSKEIFEEMEMYPKRKPAFPGSKLESTGNWPI